MSHPNLEELLLAHENGQEQSEARLHLAGGCATCAQRLEHARSILVSLSSAPLPEVPEAWIQRALSIARESNPGLLERARSFLAQLVEDSRQGTPSLSMRGAGPVTGMKKSKSQVWEKDDRVTVLSAAQKTSAGPPAGTVKDAVTFGQFDSILPRYSVEYRKIQKNMTRHAVAVS